MASCTPTSPSLKWKRHGFVCCISFPFSSFGFIWLLLFTPKELLWMFIMFIPKICFIFHVPLAETKYRVTPAKCTLSPPALWSLTRLLPSLSVRFNRVWRAAKPAKQSAANQLQPRNRNRNQKTTIITIHYCPWLITNHHWLTIINLSLSEIPPTPLVQKRNRTVFPAPRKPVRRVTGTWHKSFEKGRKFWETAWSIFISTMDLLY